MDDDSDIMEDDGANRGLDLDRLRLGRSSLDAVLSSRERVADKSELDERMLVE